LSLKAGIVGLPNVGKSTLFNALTKAGAHASNYPFATIDPNVGVVDVPDARLKRVHELSDAKAMVPTAFEFIDIAGLVEGASDGDGLGNRFLSHIREVDALVHVVRCFEDSDVPHLAGDVDPVRDVDLLEGELMLADLEVVEKRLPKIEKKARLEVDKQTVREHELLKRVRRTLLDERPLRTMALGEDERKRLRAFGFLTLKPVLYVANVGEEDLGSYAASRHYRALQDKAESEGAGLMAFSADLEAELAELSESEAADYLAEFDLQRTGLDRLIRETYDLLGLGTFFTTNENETRAWTFKRGMNAYDCAGRVHTDFQEGFIKAEVIPFDTLDAIGSIRKVREIGKARIEGKDYPVQDGDLILFKFKL